MDFGQIPLEDDVALYGLPYLLDLLLAVQNGPLGANGYRLRFEDVLANDANFLFPAARTNGLNQTFYLQYLAAGGQMPNDSTMEIDEEALRTVLEFYEELLERGLTSPDVLTYQTPAAYLTDFINRTDRPQLAIFTASEYLAMIEQQVPNMRAANIPTADGAGLSFRSGWLWVLITAEQDRQTLAARFLEQMMEPAFHASFASALNYLPMQPAILDASLPASVDSRFFADLIARAILPLPETEGGSAPRLMQEALIQVLHGDATAAAASRQAINQHAER